jgi:cysteine desulfurase family protein
MIYLDNSATSFPKPQITLSAVNRAIASFGGNPGRSGHSLCMKTAEKIYNIRKKLSIFFGASVENLIFTSNCTHSLNLAIKGCLKLGDHVIISNLEHNSVARPVFALSKIGVQYDIARFVRNDEKATINNFLSLIKPNTKAIIATHASNVTGDILPVFELGRLCHEKNILFIVDAAQSAGIIPIDIKKMNIDILCTAGHKAMYGITGTGLMVLGENIKLTSIIEGGTGSDSTSFEQPSYYPEMLECGTINTVGILSLESGLEYIGQKGIDKMYEYEMGLCQTIEHQLKLTPKITVYSDTIIGSSVPIVSFNVQDMTSMEVCEFLDKNKVSVRGGLHCSPLAHTHLDTLSTGVVRISPSCFNIQSEMLYVSSILNELC